MQYYIANWKANKSLEEATDWMKLFLKMDLSSLSSETKIIIAPPAPFLLPLKTLSHNQKIISFAVQDVSRYEKGNYTGELSAASLCGIAEYVIVGHAERRSLFHEDEKILQAKVENAQKYGLTPIYCIRADTDIVPRSVSIVSYEPLFAIGTGRNENPRQVLRIKQGLKLPDGTAFLYGGSVNRANASLYLATNEISGFLIGAASLDPTAFYQTLTAH
ncbi:triosephosphate isomerase [Candidatus Roizmanbacteria bacterium]|nr:triosephosphate isomerase [Candidatus Roizmanbacteria bacterium]